jgi:hypothetical protein
VLVKLGMSVKVGTKGWVGVSVAGMGVLVGATVVLTAVVLCTPCTIAVAVSSAGLT